MSTVSRMAREREAAGPNGIVVGLGGLAVLVAAVAVVNALGDAAAARFTEDDWLQHSGGHVLLGSIVFAVGATLWRLRQMAPPGSWSRRSLTATCGFALLFSGTSFVEAVGAYPPLGMLHIVWASAPALLLTVLGFLAVAAGGIVAAVRPPADAL